MVHRRILGLEGRTYKRPGTKRNTEWVALILFQSHCAMCGMEDPRVLQFHHRDPTKKTGKISRMVKDGVRLSRLKEEIEKCDILCANCHIIRHKEDGTIGRSYKHVTADQGLGLTDEKENGQAETDKNG